MPTKEEIKEEFFELRDFKLIEKYAQLRSKVGPYCPIQERCCPAFIGNGSGHGPNRTIICNCRAGTGGSGEITYALARRCTFEPED